MHIRSNLTAVIQTKQQSGKNDVGEIEYSWQDAMTVSGWLDLMGGDSKYNVYSAKLQDSTHIFISDYYRIPNIITAGNSRMIINDKVYDILLIDNPMEMDEQLEIYLKYVGA
ncbi:hypothetical protein [Muricomes intestini]|jgi:head-tail adaptor|uniref:hypothetical protein n=1 Tax=Muricomes intestini TaxID=1796634 RepID=UPI002FDF33CE